MSQAKFITHTMRTIKKHAFEYLLLLSIGVFFLTSLSLARGERIHQFMLLSLFVIFYISWGVMHHFLDKTLRLKVVLEYILLGAISILILQFILL